MLFIFLTPHQKPSYTTNTPLLSALLLPKNSRLWLAQVLEFLNLALEHD